MKLGLYGGTFDPVHQGHLAVADRAMSDLGLDRLLWVPARVPPHKQALRLTSAAHRIGMLELALADRPRMSVCTAEALREGPGYTADTLRAFRSLFPRAEIFFLVGADSLIDLPNWRDPMTVLEFSVVAAPRPGFHVSSLPPAVRRRVRMLRGPKSPVSSSEIRSALARGSNVGEWLSTPVREYIGVHRLYRSHR